MNHMDRSYLASCCPPRSQATSSVTRASSQRYLPHYPAIPKQGLRAKRLHNVVGRQTFSGRRSASAGGGTSGAKIGVSKSGSKGGDLRRSPATFMLIRGGGQGQDRLPTFRLSGASAASPDVAGCGLMGHLAAPTMAGCRLARPDACRRWLPVWLPRTGGRGWIEASHAQNADIRPGPENRASRSATAAPAGTEDALLPELQASASRITDHSPRPTMMVYRPCSASDTNR